MSFELQRLFRRIQHMIRPATTSANAVEGGAVQKIQVQFNQAETRDILSVQHYGFASSLKTGCDVLIANIAGDNSNGAAIASNDARYRPKNLSAGAACLYNDGGTTIMLSGNTVTVTSSGNVTINAPKLIVNGDIEATGDVKAGTISLKNHVHLNTQPGTGQSGTPKP